MCRPTLQKASVLLIAMLGGRPATPRCAAVGQGRTTAGKQHGPLHASRGHETTPSLLPPAPIARPGALSLDRQGHLIFHAASVFRTVPTVESKPQMSQCGSLNKGGIQSERRVATKQHDDRNSGDVGKFDDAPCRANPAEKRSGAATGRRPIQRHWPLYAAGGHENRGGSDGASAAGSPVRGQPSRSSRGDVVQER